MEKNLFTEKFIHFRKGRFHEKAYTFCRLKGPDNKIRCFSEINIITQKKRKLYFHNKLQLTHTKNAKSPPGDQVWKCVSHTSQSWRHCLGVHYWLASDTVISATKKLLQNLLCTDVNEYIGHPTSFLQDILWLSLSQLLRVRMLVSHLPSHPTGGDKSHLEPSTSCVCCKLSTVLTYHPCGQHHFTRITLKWVPFCISKPFCPQVFPSDKYF